MGVVGGRCAKVCRVRRKKYMVMKKLYVQYTLYTVRGYALLSVRHTSHDIRRTINYLSVICIYTRTTIRHGGCV